MNKKSKTTFDKWMKDPEIKKAFDEESKEFILIRDNDCHWYVIPESEFGDFCAWNSLDEEDERSWDVPEYAVEVGGSPTLVKFKEYRIG